jgi:hypothetical protein
MFRVCRHDRNLSLTLLTASHMSWWHTPFLTEGMTCFTLVSEISASLAMLAALLHAFFAATISRSPSGYGNTVEPLPLHSFITQSRAGGTGWRVAFYSINPAL